MSTQGRVRLTRVEPGSYGVAGSDDLYILGLFSGWAVYRRGEIDPLYRCWRLEQCRTFLEFHPELRGEA